MVLLTVFFAAVAAAIAAGVAVYAVSQHLAQRSADDRDAVVSAAVEAVLSQGSHVLGLERSQTIEAAVATVSQVAAGQLDGRSQAFEQRVESVTDELAAVRRLVADLQKERANQSGSLAAQLEALTSSHQALTQHTDALRQALASPQQRGQWGERMADDVLRAAGMREGVQYLRQTAIEGGSIPDFRFLLPGDLEVRMDVKFPIDNYLRVLEADTPADEARHTKAFVRDVRARISELHSRGYIDPRDTVDCVLLFIPNEAVYAFLHEADPDVIDRALAEKVVLCSPATLFAVLAVIRQSVDQFQLERTSDEILRCLAGITDEWERFAGALDKVGKQIDTAHRSYHEELAGTRRRVFERTLGEVNALRDAPPAVDSPAGAGEMLVAKKAAGDVRPLPEVS